MSVCLCSHGWTVWPTNLKFGIGSFYPKGAVIIYGRGWGSANLKTVCTKNLPPPRNSCARYLPPPLGSSTLKFCPPPYTLVPVHLHVNLPETMVGLSAVHIMTKWPFTLQWWRGLFRCRIDLLNFSMGYDIIAPYNRYSVFWKDQRHWLQLTS